VAGVFDPGIPRKKSGLTEAGYNISLRADAHLQKHPGKPGVVESGGAESGAFDPESAKIVATRPSLPGPIRRAMLALIG
jgi:hypothetical protein